MCDPRCNGVSCLISDFELNGAPRLELRHGRSRQYVVSLGNIADAKLDDVACAQVAVDGEVKQCQFPHPPSRLQAGADRTDLFQAQRQLLANHFAPVPRGTLAPGLLFSFQNKHSLGYRKFIIADFISLSRWGMAGFSRYAKLSIIAGSCHSPTTAFGRVEMWRRGGTPQWR